MRVWSTNHNSSRLTAALRRSAAAAAASRRCLSCCFGGGGKRADIANVKHTRRTHWEGWTIAALAGHSRWVRNLLGARSRRWLRTMMNRRTQQGKRWDSLPIYGDLCEHCVKNDSHAC